MSCLSSILKILTNASNNNYANDPLASRLYCITLCCLMVPGEDCGFRLYRFQIIVFSSTLVDLKRLLYDSFWWHTGTMHNQNVNIKHTGN